MKKKLSKQQQTQEDAYGFPYHYLDLVLETYAHLYHAEYLAKLQLVEKEVLKLDPSSVLDAGCGDGRFTYLLKRHNFRLVGLDYSDAALRFARAFNPEVEFIHADITSLKTTQPFEVVVCLDTLEHIDPRQLPKVIHGLAQRLESNGHLVVTVPTTNLSLREKHYQHFTSELITHYLSPTFRIRSIQGFNVQNVHQRVFQGARAVVSVLSPLRVLFPFIRSLQLFPKNYYLKHLAVGDPAHSLGLMVVAQKK